MREWAALLVGSSIVACGGIAAQQAAPDGGPEGPGAADAECIEAAFVSAKSIAGTPLVIVDAAATIRSGSPGIYPSMAIYLTSAPGACAEFNGHLTPGALSLHLWVFNFLDAQPIGPGTYSVLPDDGGAPSVQASAFTHHYGPHCQDATSYFSVAGSLTLSDVGAVVCGSFDFTLNDGTRVAGHFSATVCHPDAGWSASCG
jgi:hypothetical protein